MELLILGQQDQALARSDVVESHTVERGGSVQHASTPPPHIQSDLSEVIWDHGYRLSLNWPACHCGVSILVSFGQTEFSSAQTGVLGATRSHQGPWGN